MVTAEVTGAAVAGPLAPVPEGHRAMLVDEGKPQVHAIDGKTR
jgi:hypothetical protein